MNRKSNKLQVKDLVTIGIISAIYFVINLIVMVDYLFAVDYRRKYDTGGPDGGKKLSILF